MKIKKNYIGNEEMDFYSFNIQSLMEEELSQRY